VKQSVVTAPITRVAAATARDQDFIAVEEPLQIRLNGTDLAITMRTPGHDPELAVGFLFAEGILPNREAIDSMEQGDNSISITTVAEASPDLSAQTRHFYLTSSCGVCGKASVDALVAAGCPMLPRATPLINAEILHSLPESLRATQAVFDRTGGLHAAGLFDVDGTLRLVREDVGRHNAVDKLIGRSVIDGKVPLDNSILMVSGRVSFELVQKALMAGIPALAAVGAPSSLAVETALRFGMTLVGFLRDARFNVYAGEDRLVYSK
jgi:FdhD protein